VGDFADYSVTDFATDDFFIKHQLTPTQESTLFWAQWLASHPEQQAVWDEAKKLLEAVLSGLTEYTRTFLSEEAEAQLLQRIMETNQLLIPKTPVWNRTIGYYSAAAALLVAVLLFVLLTKNGPKETIYQQQLAELPSKISERANKTAVPQTFYLPDSSKVTLYPNSRLSFNSRPELENRAVYLSGKALFDVVKDPHKPFLVFANETITKVLGTQFEVSAFDADQDVIVTVQSGQVTVYQNQGTASLKERLHNGVLLHPNQQVIYKRSAEQFNKMLSNNPQFVAPPDERPTFVYDEEYLSAVFTDIENAYGVDIIYNKEIMESCQLTANISEEPLKDKLDIICRSVGARCDIIDAQIVITSKGCLPSNFQTN
jgi:transmembrane sensor